MKRLAIIAALAASPALADGPSAFVDPPVAKPICTTTFLFWTWRTPCNAPTTSTDRDSDRDIRVVVGIPPSDGHPDPSKPERPVTERVKGNNGLGNGDQRAPGRSLPHNRAENEIGTPGHRSGKPQKSN